LAGIDSAYGDGDLFTRDRRENHMTSSDGTTREGGAPGDELVQLLNSLLGLYWMAAAQHQTHVALLKAWGVTGLAGLMQQRIDDEPVTIAALTNRILDLDGQPKFDIGAPNIGTDLRSVLENDIAIQRGAPSGLNAAAEAAAAAHDATTRTLIEQIIVDEEQHLNFLKLEHDLFDRLGEQLYLSTRINRNN
jgi:bacterioferritin